VAKGQHLAEFEIYVMAALVRLGEEAYGMTVRQEIEARSGRAVAIGAVYG
jgi:PadR family transcriptional regulator PadR